LLSYEYAVDLFLQGSVAAVHRRGG